MATLTTVDKGGTDKIIVCVKGENLKKKLATLREVNKNYILTYTSHIRNPALSATFFLRSANKIDLAVALTFFLFVFRLNIL